ncbi:hypothetical protein FKW77_008802 [Venturia effusa]|uniref:Uncharacterized protein n=1 Tax=Venturia effusa TaxID=50376 RepID=A0A517L400_9PEZI|nr:hypothetical protein FKW77_008802 [Venturia effusa]
MAYFVNPKAPIATSPYGEALKDKHGWHASSDVCALIVRHLLQPGAQPSLTPTTNSTRLNRSSPAAPSVSVSQTDHQPDVRAHKENIAPSSASRTSPLSHTLSRQKSSIHIGGTSIPILSHQNQEEHRATLDHSPSYEKSWSATFPRSSCIPVRKTPEKIKSQLPVPITSASVKPRRSQLPRDKPKSNLTTLFDRDHRPPIQSSSPKSSSPSSTKIQAPLLQTQLRAEERQRLKIRLEEMGRKNRSKGSKKARSNDVADKAEVSLPTPAKAAPKVEESTSSAGAVQKPSTLVYGIEPQAAPSCAVAATISPPETFAMPSIASAVSSPRTFYSAFGSPVSDSTTSGIFDYAMTGHELVSTDKIEESMLDSTLKDESSLNTIGDISSSNVASKSSEISAPQPQPADQEVLIAKPLPSIVVTNTSDHFTSAEDSDDSEMSTVVPEDFTVKEAAATGAQPKKKKKQKKKKAAAADTDFRYSFDEIPELHFTLVGEKVFLKRGPVPDAAVDERIFEDVELTTKTGESVGRDLTSNQWAYFQKVRPDLRFGPEHRTKPSIRSGDIDRPGVGKTLKNEYQTISTINIGTEAIWRPGNTLRDASPTDGLYVDAAIVELVTNIKPEQDVATSGSLVPATKSNKNSLAIPTSGKLPAPLLSEKAQGKQKVNSNSVPPVSQMSEKARGKQKATSDPTTVTSFLNPEARVFTPGPVKADSEAELEGGLDDVSGAAQQLSEIKRPSEGAFAYFLQTHPKAKFVYNAAEAYALSSHEALGAPIIRPVPTEAHEGVSFLQGRRISPTKSPEPKAAAGGGAPENLYPAQPERYNQSHLFDLDDKEYETKTFITDGKQFQVHNFPHGSFVTNKDGVLVAPPGDSPLFTKKLSPMLFHLPLSHGVGETRHNGVPMGTSVINPQPPCYILDRSINPYFQGHGAKLEVMPRPDSSLNEQFLIAFQKATEPYFLRQELSADVKWMEPSIPTGFSERAKHRQGIGRGQTATETSVKVAHPSTGELTEGTLIKPGLRGGGDAMMPSNVMITVDAVPNSRAIPQTVLDNTSRKYSWLKGILLDTEPNSSEQPPYVILPDGAMEPIFIDRNLQRIANNPAKSKKATKLCGGYLAPVGTGNKVWSNTDRYTCACCGSLYHGLKHCPAHHKNNGKANCMSCGQTDHILAACPYPIQNVQSRTIVESLRLYLGTLHCRISILTWEFEMKVIDEDKFLKLRTEMVKNPLKGEALHALANIPGCPHCDSSSHQQSIASLIEACADRCRARGDIPEEWLTPGNWMYDLRRCPLYIMIYNKNIDTHEFFAYNHLDSVAMDAIYRDFLRAQEWHIKTPLPQMDFHFHSKPRPTYKAHKSKLPPYQLARDVLAGDKEYPCEWIRESQENDFFTWV